MTLTIMKHPQDFVLHDDFLCCFQQLGYFADMDDLSLEELVVIDIFFSFGVDPTPKIYRLLVLGNPGLVCNFMRRGADRVFPSILQDILSVTAWITPITRSEGYEAEKGIEAPSTDELIGAGLEFLQSKPSSKPQESKDSCKVVFTELPPFTGHPQDYFVWKFQVQSKLAGNGMLGLIDPTDETGSYAVTHPKQNAILHSMLIHSLSQGPNNNWEISQFIISDSENTDTAFCGRTVWNKLLQLYEEGPIIATHIRKKATQIRKLTCGSGISGFLDFTKKYLALKNQFIHLQRAAIKLNVEVHERFLWKDDFLTRLTCQQPIIIHANFCSTQEEMDLWNSILYIYSRLTLQENSGENPKSASSRKRKANAAIEDHDETPHELEQKKSSSNSYNQSNNAFLSRAYNLVKSETDPAKKEAVVSFLSDLKSNSKKNSGNAGGHSKKTNNKRNKKRRKAGKNQDGMNPTSGNDNIPIDARLADALGIYDCQDA